MTHRFSISVPKKNRQTEALPVSEGAFMLQSQGAKFSKHYNFLGLVKDVKKSKTKQQKRKHFTGSCRA